MFLESPYMMGAWWLKVKILQSTLEPILSEFDANVTVDFSHFSIVQVPATAAKMMVQLKQLEMLIELRQESIKMYESSQFISLISLKRTFSSSQMVTHFVKLLTSNHVSLSVMDRLSSTHSCTVVNSSLVA